MNVKRLYADIDRAPSRTELLKFAATLLGACLLIGAVMGLLLHDYSRARCVLVVGVVAFLVALVPYVGRVFYVAWMALGVTLSLLSSPLVLAAIFFLVITPVAILMKLLRRDSMKRQLDPKAATYWQEYAEPEDLSRYMKQF